MNRSIKTVLILSLLANLGIFYVAYKAIEYRSHINVFLDKYTYVINEISQRNYYEKENQHLKSDTAISRRIVFFGSQVIEKWETDNFYREYEIINRGVPNQRVSGFLLRFRPDVIELKPKAVLIEISSYNFRPENTVAEIKDYLKSMVELARTNAIIPIPTTTIPFCRDSIDLGKYILMDTIRVYNEWLEDYCRKQKLAYIDFNRTLADESGHLPYDFSMGAIDPNKRGYDLLNKEVLRVLDSIK